MLEEKILSERISGCAAMIKQHAYRVHSAIPAEHRRWIDKADVVQEGYIAALEAESKYDPSKGSKYSSFCYNALTFHFSHEFVGRLSRQKRSMSYEMPDGRRRVRSEYAMVEIDALPAPGEIADTKDSLSPTVEANAVNSFTTLCGDISPKALVWFVGTIMSNSRSWDRVVPLSGTKSQEWINELKNAAAKHNIRYNDVQTMMKSDAAQKLALITLARNSSIGLGTEMDARVLQCIDCQGRFALAAIRSGRYIAETMTCRSCYQKMREKEPAESCFGKIKTSDHEGYSEQDVECSLHCKDRKVCRQFISEERSLMKEKKTRKPATEETETAQVTEEQAAPTSSKKKKASPPPPPPKAAKGKKENGAAEEEEAPKKKSAKAEKAEKPEKAEKAAKKAASNGDSDDYPAPKEVVRWPHKTGSWMQYCFQCAFQGCKAAELEAETVKEGRKWPIFLKVLRGGRSGMKRPTHTWKLDESGGKLRIYDVKYLGGAEA